MKERDDQFEAPATGGSPEMTACPACSRMVPATRFSCVYCGAELQLDEAQRKRIVPVARSAEDHESGFNIVSVAGSLEQLSGSIVKAAKMLGLEEEDLRTILGAEGPLPLVRTASAGEAELVKEKLSDLGIAAEVVPDEALALGSPPVRLRTLLFRSGMVEPVPFNPDGEPPVAGKIELMVTGVLVKKEVFSTEKKQRSGGARILDSSEEGSDERVIDIYTDTASRGYRIRESGFDFSCLGDAKGLLASENLPLLIGKLRKEFPSAKIIDEYPAVRGLLGVVWPVDESSSSRGFERKSFGGYAQLRAVETNNEGQFTRWSRLNRALRSS